MVFWGGFLGGLTGTFVGFVLLGLLVCVCQKK